eukprot:4619352-Amphidinium_carterae.2
MHDDFAKIEDVNDLTGQEYFAQEYFAEEAAKEDDIDNYSNYKDFATIGEEDPYEEHYILFNDMNMT